MPLSEFHQAMRKGRPESNQSKMTNCPSDVSSFMPDNEFVELLWENGQIVMQGQSSRPKKSAFPTTIPSHHARVQEKEGGSPKAGRCSAMDPMLNNDLSPAVPTAHIGMNAQVDDMVPWMNYPLEDPLQNDYCSEFFSEFPGLNLSSLSTHNNAMPTDRSSGLGLGRDSHNVEHGHPMKPMTGGQEASRVKTSQFFQLSQQCQNNRSRPSELGAGNNISAHQGPSGDQLGVQFQKQDITTPKLLQPSSSMGLMNFSHFSRPVALVKANLQSVDRIRSNEKASTATTSNPINSTLAYTTSGLKSVPGVQGKLASPHPRLDLRPSVKPSQEGAAVAQSEAVCQEDAPRHGNNDIANTDSRPPDDNNHPSSSFAASMAGGRHETEKGSEAVVASSVCSGNSAGPASNDPKQRAKRKTCEGDESGYQTEDLEDDSVVVKKPATGRGTSTKRSRAAEVHNLSERRRRDRINERMRALQELIPNCNKVDKASMLDEAIEYLKTLQLQVQIMSMGSGLCMPPVMLPAGMQHLRAPHMAHFSPMGVGMGMGMGMGYRMGMLDMNGSPGCPLIPMPPIHGSQFPCPSIPGAQGLHGMAGSTSLQMFGIPGQAFPMSMARPPPPFGSFMGPSTRPNLVPEVSGTATSSVPAANAAPASSSKDQQQQNTNLDTVQKTSVDDSKILISAQAAKECFKKSTVAQMSDQTSHVKGNDAINSSSDTGLSPTGKTCYGRQVVGAG